MSLSFGWLKHVHATTKYHVTVIVHNIVEGTFLLLCYCYSNCRISEGKSKGKLCSFGQTSETEAQGRYGRSLCVYKCMCMRDRRCKGQKEWPTPDGKCVLSNIFNIWVVLSFCEKTLHSADNQVCQMSVSILSPALSDIQPITEHGVWLISQFGEQPVVVCQQNGSGTQQCLFLRRVYNQLIHSDLTEL